MRSLRIIFLALALVFALQECNSQTILRETINSAGKAINDLASVSLGAVKTVVNVVDHSLDRGLDVAIDGRDLIVEKIKEALYKFQAIMISGSTELGIPQLEPFTVDHVAYNIKHAIGKFKGTFDKLKIEDLSNFTINDVSFKVLGSKLHVNLTLPTIRVTEGFYEVDGIIGELFKLFGKGPFTLTFFKFDVIVDCQIGRKDGEFVLNTLHVKVKLGSAKCDFKNIEGGGKLEKVFNKMLSEILPEAIDLLWPEIEGPLTEEIKPIFQFTLIPKRIIRYANKLSDLFSVRRIFRILG